MQNEIKKSIEIAEKPELIKQERNKLKEEMLLVINKH